MGVTYKIIEEMVTEKRIDLDDYQSEEDKPKLFRDIADEISSKVGDSWSVTWNNYKGYPLRLW